MNIPKGWKLVPEESPEEDHLLLCPECGSSKILGHEETAWWLSTMEHWCQTIKMNDDAKALCTECEWVGMRSDLVEEAIVTIDELRKLAALIEDSWPEWSESKALPLKGANYLRACADALEEANNAFNMD